LVEALCYKPEGSWFDSLEFFIDLILPATVWAWGPASNRNEYHEYFLGGGGGKGSRWIGLTTLPPSCADWKSGSLNILESLGPVQACMGIALPSKIANWDKGGTEPTDDYTFLYIYMEVKHQLWSGTLYVRESYHSTVYY
jgi:hypothetical protein